VLEFTCVVLGGSFLYVKVDFGNGFATCFSPRTIAAFVFDPPNFATGIGDNHHPSATAVDRRVLEHEFDGRFGGLVSAAVGCDTWVGIGIYEYSSVLGLGSLGFGYRRRR